ncbi:MAG: amidohydrolase family protein [Desulfurococcales archaeon]|nr:amidohydrolase family protein [Desulfurococcales archaeon]
MNTTPLHVGLALLGDTLEPAREVCIYLDENFTIQSIEKTPCEEPHFGSSSLILVPAPANAHTHLGDAAFPEYNTILPLEDLVKPPNGLKHQLLRQLDDNQFIDNYAQILKEARNAGTGIIIDYREGGARGCRLARQAHLKTGLPPKLLLHGRPSTGENPEETAEECHGFGLPSPLNYTKKELTRIFQISKTKDIPVSAHIAETPKTRKQGDLELLLETGTPDYIVHGLHLSEEDLTLIAEKNIAIAISPSSNLFHAIGAPKLHLLYKLGIRVAWGTDNAAWNPPWPWREAWLAYLLGRVKGLKQQDYAKWVLKGLLIEGYRLARLKPPIIREGATLNALLINGEQWIIKARDVYAALLKRIDTRNLVSYVGNPFLY